MLIKESILYNPQRAKELMQKGLKPIDCTSFILEAMTRGQNKNFHREDFATGAQIAKWLKNSGFESIYCAENTIDESPTYRYGVLKQFHNKEFIKKIKRGDKGGYKFPIDYLVIDENFKNPLFQKFIDEASGFVFLQEGTHLGFLNKGRFFDAHISADPLIRELFSSRRFYSLIDNKEPIFDYQNSIICLPNGKIEEFLYQNKGILKSREDYFRE